MSEIIAKNLRYIRKGHKETQEELGNAIGVAHNTISMYEKGEREIDYDKLQAIASHYGVPVESFMLSDFSQFDFDFTISSWDQYLDVFNDMLPVIVSEEALKNPSFKRGYDFIQQIQEYLKNKQRYPILSSVFFDAMMGFAEALSDDPIQYEASANLLYMYILNYSMLPDEHSKKIGEAVLFGESKKPDFRKKFMLKDANPISKEDAEAKLEYVRDSYETMTQLITILKKSDKYYELADYYIALRYMLGMVDNEKSQETNQYIGIEMLSAFAEVGNKYALKFIEKTEEF